MEIEDIQKRKKEERKSIVISIRTFPSYSQWLREKNISPNALFHKAIEELMEKTENGIN